MQQTLYGCREVVSGGQLDNRHTSIRGRRNEMCQVKLLLAPFAKLCCPRLYPGGWSVQSSLMLVHLLQYKVRRCTPMAVRR